MWQKNLFNNDLISYVFVFLADGKYSRKSNVDFHICAALHISFVSFYWKLYISSFPILYNIMLDVSWNEFRKAISVGIQGILRIKKWNLSYRFEYWYWLVSYQSSYQKLSCHCWPSNRRQEACNVIKCLTGECILTAHFLQPTL